ncbi:unnamed protein product [Parajaminaea phylloscopi]
MPLARYVCAGRTGQVTSAMTSAVMSAHRTSRTGQATHLGTRPQEPSGESQEPLPPHEPELGSSPSSHASSLIDETTFSDVSSLDDEDYEIIGESIRPTYFSSSGPIESISDSTAWIDGEGSTVVADTDSMLLGSVLASEVITAAANPGITENRGHGHQRSDTAHPLHLTTEHDQDHEHHLLNSTLTPTIISTLSHQSYPLSSSSRITLSESAGQGVATASGHSSLDSSASSALMFPDPTILSEQAHASLQPDTEPQRKIIDWLSRPSRAQTGDSTHAERPGRDKEAHDAAASAPKRASTHMTKETAPHRYLWMHWLLAFMLGFGGAMWAFRGAMPIKELLPADSRLGHATRHYDGLYHGMTKAHLAFEAMRATPSLTVDTAVPSTITDTPSPKVVKKSDVAVASKRSTDLAVYRYLTSSQSRRIESIRQPESKAVASIPTSKARTDWISHAFASQLIQQLQGDAGRQWRALESSLRSAWAMGRAGSYRLQKDARDEWKYWQSRLQEIWVQHIWPVWNELVHLYGQVQTQQADVVRAARRGARNLGIRLPGTAKSVSDWLRGAQLPERFSNSVLAASDGSQHLQRRMSSFGHAKLESAKKWSDQRVQNAVRGACRICKAVGVEDRKDSRPQSSSSSGKCRGRESSKADLRRLLRKFQRPDTSKRAHPAKASSQRDPARRAVKWRDPVRTRIFRG